MANIFYDTDGAFSGLTPKKIVAGAFAPNLVGTYEALNTARYQTFTPSEAGDCTGIVVNTGCAATITAAAVYTCVLQEQTSPGTWTDRATKTLTWADIAGSHSGASNKDMHSQWAYFEFAAPYAITAAADTWRLKISADTANAVIAPTYGYAVVISTTTSYSSGDNIATKQNSTITIDQSITAAALCTGAGTHLVWENPPVASYTLTITDFYYGHNTRLEVGDSTDRIPYAEQAIIAITNWRGCLFNTYGDNLEVQLYGEKPTNHFTTLAADCLASQAVIVTADDMSASWVATDSIVISGISTNATSGQETKVIDSILGTSVTMTTNVLAHDEGWWVLNFTRAAKCGVTINGLYYSPAAGSSVKPVVNKISGVYMTGNVVNNRFYNGYTPEVYQFDFTRSTTQIFDCLIIPTYGITFVFLSSICETGSGMTDVFLWRTGSSNNSISISCTNTAGVHISKDIALNGIYLAHVQGNTNRTLLAVTAIGWTISNLMACGCYSYSAAGYQLLTLVLTSCTLTNIKTISGAINMYATLNACTITNWTAEFNSYTWYLSGSSLNNVFTNVDMNQKHAVGGYQAVYFAYNYGNPLFYDSKFEAGEEAYLTDAVAGSTLRAHNYGDGDINDNRVFYIYGKMYSTGDGLSDTTAHTAGAGKYAIRFEPTSSTNNLEWRFSVPTGDIQGRTMTVAVWCKVNSANYYSGVHGLPRLSVDYDNGTVIYDDASASTDWQLLSVTFSPTTSYGQIVITLSARTDQTGSSAYVYFDDFAVLYPAGYIMSLGGMDLWAEAMPVLPPIATVLSALDVWTAAASVDYGAGTMGNLLTDNVDAAISTRATPADITALAGGDGDTLETLSDQIDGIGGGGLSAQEVRDAMKLAPTAGDPDEDSIDEVLDDIVEALYYFVDTAINIQGRLPDALTANGNIKSSLTEILTTELTETMGQIAAGFKKLFDVTVPVMTMENVNQSGDSYALVSTEVAEILADTNELQSDLTNGGRIDLLIDAIKAKTDNLPADPADQSAVEAAITAATSPLATAASIAALNNLSAVEVNAEVVDALNVDTYAEPGQGAPAATASLAAKIGYLYKAWRNKKTQTETTLSIFNDAGDTVDQKATVSDDATTFTKNEVGSGP